MISKTLFRLLKTKFWGVGFESELPPEFVITNHAERRLKKRIQYAHRHQLPKLMLDAWYLGIDPPETFKPEKATRPEGHFHKFVYKYHMGYVWVWGIRFTKTIPGGQKHLITIYNWR